MYTDSAIPKDPYFSTRAIEEGLKSRDVKAIESGLSTAYDLFVNYALEGHQENLLALGRNLNSIYFPYRSEANDISAGISEYLGQLRALINLSEYIAHHLVPLRSLQVVGQSKHAKQVLQALLKNGSLRATDLAGLAQLPHKAQLVRTMQPLVDERLVRREKFGKNVWYSLTSAGKLIVTKHFGTSETGISDDAAMQALLSRAKNCLQRPDYQALTDTLLRIRSVLIPAQHPVVQSNLAAMLLSIAIDASIALYVNKKKEFDLRLGTSLDKSIPPVRPIRPYSDREGRRGAVKSSYTRATIHIQRFPQPGYSSHRQLGIA
ncbi:MAG: hypothetical protein HY662_02175 [Chloroflexi bacterium]|nr:hypothetical protein [Chloroflexota bacterium]